MMVIMIDDMMFIMYNVKRKETAHLEVGNESE
jgi:hypothetical protein